RQRRYKLIHRHSPSSHCILPHGRLSFFWTPYDFCRLVSFVFVNQVGLIQEEEFGVRETYSEHGTQSSPTRLEVMEDELAGKQQEIEELNRELEEMRAAYGTEGLQQLQEFEMAIKQRDGIITQLTTNLQQARKEKDDIMREFLELTEQSQNLKIQFQHLQASETIRNTSRTSTAADLFQSRQQIFTYQQQLEEQEQRLKHYQKENEKLQLQLLIYQFEFRITKTPIKFYLTVNGLKSALIDEEQKSCQLKEMITAADRTVHELREELTLKSQEINSLTEELNISKQKERRSSEEIKQLMGTVEDLQKKHHKDAQSEADIVHRLELETQRKLEQLQAELDEMYGQQIVQMKQELVKQHTLEIEKLGAEHKATVENLSNQTEINAQIQTLTSTVSGLNSQLQHADEQSTKMKEDLDHRLEAASSEKSLLQRQIEDLLQDLSFAREQIHRARQTISEKESRLNEANSLQATIESLRSELASANEFTKELETKHEAEVTNYKIKLDMLEREKDAVLGRMAESQEAELEKLRTYFLFSQEEELSKLREDLAREHRINVENLKANLDMQYNERMDRLQREMGQIICDLQSENEGLLTNQDSLVVEMSKLSELLQSVNDPKSAATMTQVNEVRVDLDSLTKGQEKGSVEQELQALQLKIELLQAELKDKHIFRERIAALELDNTLLKEQNNTLQKASKKTIIDHGETSLSDGANADSLVFKREIEILSAENKRLCNLELQSREEIERQKNTFSFAEKNFEVNYHELQEEYTCLLNIKVQLEEDQAKLDEEYQLKLCALNDELSKLKLDSKQANDSALEGSLTLIEADALGGVEVVEKDTTELMEKLEIAQRDKQELSQRVSDLSEQVHLKQREINQLKEQVKSLHGERDHSLGDGQEAEESRKSVHPNNCTSSYSLVDFGELQPETQNLLEEKEPSPKVLYYIFYSLYFLITLPQADMRLQMEAQRISLSQIHLAHMNLVSENFQTEKAQEIHSLKEEMQRVQEQKLEELQDGHQQELKELWYLGSVCLFFPLEDLKTRKITTSLSEGAEKFKNEFNVQRTQLEEKHTQEIEHLRSYFQQQLKETEERYTMEIIRLQEQLHSVSQASLEFRVCSWPVPLFAVIWGEGSPLGLTRCFMSSLQDYNQMVAMGAESAKLYEERVEDMRQELVRLEQEHQQATEALRLAHAAQLERQMCDQEQLLTELQTVRAQLAEVRCYNVENQATERERILIEELESLKLARLENREKQGFMCHENSSQTERANKRLSKILLEIVKTTGAVEETIGRHVVGLLDKSGRRLSNTKVLAWCPDAACDTEAPLAVSDLEKKVPSWSGDEGSKLPQLLTEEELDVNPEDEGHVLNIVTRLQAAVEKLLEAINNTSNQLEHAKAAQTELVRESIKRKQETTGLLRIQEELQERLNEEAKAREHLAVELGKAEGLLDGYTDDRVFLEKQMQEKNDLIQHLEQELHSTGNRLQEFEQERQQIQEERELLSRQKNALKADTGTAEQQLLEETEKLFKEKIEVQRQAEKDSGDFHKQVKVLETELEDQVNRYLELEQEKNAELEDLRQKNLALEKQLEKTRKFLDEQAVDREHERDVFQQEIQKLEQQLKMPQRHQPTNGQQSNQVETLENNLKEKTDKCNELLLSKEQLQRDVQERNEEIEKLECRIRELEQAVLISADNLQKVLKEGVKGEMPLEALLQVEREAMDRKEKEITNLEEQLEQFREELENKNEEVQQLHMQLEIQKKESATKIHGLEQESKLLKVRELLASPDSTFKTSKPGKHEELLLLKDQEIDQLSEQISRLQAQVEAAPDNKDSEMLQLEDQMELLSKRTEEINQLNGVIATLQKELSHAMQKSTPQTLLKSKDSERINQNLTTAMPQEDALHQDARLNNDEMNLTLLELEETKSKVKVLKEELEKLRMAREIAQNASDDTAFGLVMAKVESRPADGKEGQEILGEKHESLLTNQAWQTTINAMEAELQELQKVLAEKDLELLQYSNEIELLKEQVKAEGDQHDQMMVAMEDTLREKVAAALVSEAQIKAIQVHTTKLMQRSDVISVLEENSKGTQASASTEGKEAESKLSELSLRLLQLEKQLADLHEELQVERDNVNAANQQAAEKECKLRELQSVLESTMARPRDVQIAIQPGDEELFTLVSVPFQSNAMADLGQELEIVKAEAAATKEELCHYRELAEKLKEEMTMKETRVAHLQEELCNTKKVLSEVEERLSQYLKREEELAEQNKQSLDLLDGIGGPGQPAFERTTSSSQTDNASSVHNGNQTTRVHHVDKEVQKDMDTRQKRVASDEVQELVEQYSEKFGQMQDLHAAEILDMEARHIAEADSLRRETYVAVQSLTEECESLKAVIEALKSVRNSVILYSLFSKASEILNGKRDWSQEFYGQGFDSTAEEMGNDDGVDVEALSGFLPSKIKTLLRAVHQEGIQVLSLSESAIVGQNMQLPGTSPQFWMEERKSLVETIGCLKKLIGKMQNEDRSEVQLGDGLDFPDGTPDWRGDLLQAIQDVFCKEQEVLMAAYHTQLDTLGTCDAATLVKQMQHRLEEMGVEQINAMDCIQNADRRSLLLEIQDLRSQLSGLRSVGTVKVVSPSGDVIDNTVQEDQPAQTRKTHTQLNVLKTKGTEVHSERSPAAEMNDELAQTKQKLESALKPGHTHFKELESLRCVHQFLDVVHKALMNEQKKNRDLQWALEEERAKTEKSDLKQELDLDIIIEDQRLKNEELSILLETEKQIVKGLQDRISSMEMAHESELSQERSNSSELQTVLQVEKARSAELANAFHIKREMESQTESHVGEGQMPEINPAEDLLQELHGQLESKHQHVVALTSEVESTRLECEQLRQSLEEARASHLKELLAQQDSANTAHQQAEALKSQVEDLQRKLKKTMLDLQKLEVDRTRLKETVQNLQNNVHEEPDGSRAERKGLVDSAVSFTFILSQLNFAVPPGSSTNSLTERLLTQNAELTGHVSRLTEEKNDLRNALLRMEDETSRYMLTGSSGDHSPRSPQDSAVNIDRLMAIEREQWKREKLQYQKSLKECEAELHKVKAELKSVSAHRDTGRECENSVIKRVYGKYLRSESFRKALVYQKKYLLLLLGGFQECEEATLSLIARMGGLPSYTDLTIITNRSRAFTRFRSAVRVSIAISRMKFLVCRCLCCTLIVQPLPTRCCGLSDLSPCSHIQNYDPDRALTDYITRLEALQKRLGGAQTGNRNITGSSHNNIVFCIDK
uniref:A-kinase anchoring protein 9 n=1 Tax=Leptobrachium leishanense TaxID=445787 RepID=A0A8C5QK64_9ANUR